MMGWTQRSLSPDVSEVNVLSVSQVLEVCIQMDPPPGILIQLLPSSVLVPAVQHVQYHGEDA